MMRSRTQLRERPEDDEPTLGPFEYSPSRDETKTAEYRCIPWPVSATIGDDAPTLFDEMPTVVDSPARSSGDAAGSVGFAFDRDTDRMKASRIDGSNVVVRRAGAQAPHEWGLIGTRAARGVRLLFLAFIVTVAAVVARHLEPLQSSERRPQRLAAAMVAPATARSAADVPEVIPVESASPGCDATPADTAVRALVEGRLREAACSFVTLSKAPGAAPPYATLARLLKRHGSSACAIQTWDVSCPEVQR